MTIKLIDIRLKMMHQLTDVLSKSKQSGTFLQSNIIYNPGPNIFLIITAVIFVLATVLISSWANYWIYIVSGGIIAYLLARQFQKIYRWKELGRDCVFFDPIYFYTVNKFNIIILPLSEYQYSDVNLSADKKNYYARFHFNNTTILQPCNSNTDPKVLSFQNNLSNYGKLIRQSSEVTKVPKDFIATIKDKLNSNQIPLIISGFVVVILLFITPIIIDFNQFRKAKDLNTATSYRQYLSVYKNIRYREAARIKLKSLYNYYINEYTNKASNSAGAESFQKVLEYLRDKDLYSMRLVFTSTSAVKNILKYGYNIIPITPSFSPDKNAARQNDVFSAINSTLGTIFPSDIITLADENLDDLPILQVHYVYKNQYNSFYYSVEQESIQENMRTWYYGIDIDWYFQLYIPTEEESLFAFSLTSQPAPRFTSESFSPDAIYNNMAISAFLDFKNEFHSNFFNWLLE